MFRVDPFEDNDRETCKALWLTYEQGKTRPDGHDTIFESIWRALSSDSKLLNGLCLRTQAERRPVGFAFFVEHFCTKSLRPEGYLGDIFVSEAFRRKGGGRLLMDSLIRHGRDKGWESLSWITRPENLAARTLYDRYGSGVPSVRYKISTRD